MFWNSIRYWYSYEFLFIIVSQNIKNSIASIIPNCFPPPVCTSGKSTISLERTTKKNAIEESFIIVDRDDNVLFRQPLLSDNQQHRWSVTLCNDHYTLIMTAFCGSGWSRYSNVIIWKGSTRLVYGSCSQYKYYQSFNV